METTLHGIASHPGAAFFAFCLALAMAIDFLARRPFFREGLNSRPGMPITGGMRAMVHGHTRPLHPCVRNTP